MLLYFFWWAFRLFTSGGLSVTSPRLIATLDECMQIIRFFVNYYGFSLIGFFASRKTSTCSLKSIKCTLYSSKWSLKSIKCALYSSKWSSKSVKCAL